MNICKRVAFTLTVLFAALCLAPAAANAMTIYAEIEGEAGDPLALEVESSTSIDNVKEKVKAARSIPVEQQAIYYEGLHLNLGRTLAEYNIQKESTLTVKMSAEVPIDAEHFPDANFMAIVESFDDDDGDGVLDADEIAAVTEINCRKSGISSLEGIQYFTALRKLNCDENDGLKTLDVSKNTSLVELSCYWCYLSSLDVSGCTELEKLECSMNELTQLDVSHNAKLTSLSCYLNQLSSLDVGNNASLVELNCWYNALSGLDVSDNAALETLNCGRNDLGSLDVSNNARLRTLECEQSGLSTLDVGDNPALEELQCQHNSLSSLDVSKNTKLKTLYCNNSKMASLILGQNSALEDLLCSSNELTSLDLSACTSLTQLNCYKNRLAELDVTNSPQLQILWAYDNDLASLDVSQNGELVELVCDTNRLTSLDVSNNPKLEMLYCSDCSYLIGVDEAGRFDLSTLPGFDVARASDWVGGSVSGNVLTVPDGADSVTYTYDCGLGESETFTLEVGYAVSFDTDGGSAVESQAVAKDGAATKPADPTKDKYTFAGWYADEACTQEFDFSTPITKATTIYAKWTPAKDEGEGEKDEDEQGKGDKGDKGDKGEKGNDGKPIPQTGDPTAYAPALLSGLAALAVGLAVKAGKRND